jgi:glycosyltransferase involved in cell wall biosynthesis
VGRLPVIGTAAALVPGAGISAFLHAARRVVEASIDAEFVVAGVGSSGADLRRLAERLDLADRVTFAEPPARTRPFWQVLDIYCQPSLVPCSGQSVITALSWAVPTITTDVPGLRTWVTDGATGVRVTPGDSEDLARAILALLATPEKAIRLGRSGRERVARECEPGKHAAHLSTLYRRVVGRQDGARSTAEPQPVSFRALGQPRADSH